MPGASGISGIKATDDVKKCYDRVHMSKGRNKLPYAIFKFSDGLKSVIVDEDPKFYKQQVRYDALLDLLPSDSSRFLAFDLPHLNKDGTKTSSVIFVSWFPKDCAPKERFAVGTTVKGLVDTLNVSKYYEGEDTGDLNQSHICERNNWKICPEELADALSTDPIKIKDDEED